MARTPAKRLRDESLAARRVPVTFSEDEAMTVRASRMARFAAGARRSIARAAAVGALMAAGWLLAVLFGALSAPPASAQTATPASAEAAVTATPAAAEAAASATPAAAEAAASATSATPASVETTADAHHVATGPVQGDFPTVDGKAPAQDNAEAMAGMTVDGLTSQSKPTLPVPSTAGKTLGGANGLVPNGGGSGPFGPGMGDVARSQFDPRIESHPAPLAAVLPPVVRTAADDPSFSPD